MVALESDIVSRGWTVVTTNFLSPQAISTQVAHGGCHVVLTAPSGRRFGADGRTRADAFRAAVQQAGLLPATE